MEPLTLALGLIALVAVGVALWLASTRRALRSAVAEAQTAAETADRARDEAERSKAEAIARLEAALEQRDRECARLMEDRKDAIARADESTKRVLTLTEQLSAARQQLSDMEALRQELAQNEQRLKEAFAALSAKALSTTREEFLAQAKPVFEAATKEQSGLVTPIREVLERTQKKLEEFDQERLKSFERLDQKLQTVTSASEQLRSETERLTRALSRPEVRGRYGEIQLRRVAELAGMTPYCDFSEQESTRDDAGRLQRPDMIVRLPNERIIAIDAKTNTYAYLQAVNARDDAERQRLLEDFARHVHEQVRKLGDKAYWKEFADSPEFVVMFVPGDHFIDAALSRRPELIEFAAERNVVLASPSTLIALLRAVHVGWREHRLSEQSKELFALGRELHERATVAFDHIVRLGDSIRQSVERYNGMVGSIDSRLVPTLRKFEDAGARSAKPIPQLSPVDQNIRQFESGSS